MLRGIFNSSNRTLDKGVLIGMKEQIDILIKLQKIELETNSVKSILGEVSKRFDVLDSGLEDFKKRMEDEDSLISELKKKYRQCESDVQTNLSQAAKSQEKLRAVKTNKEYQSMLKEIEEITGRNSAIEDTMLEHLDRIDEVEKNIATEKEEYLKLSDQVKSEKRIINQEVEEGKKKLAGLETDWNEVSRMVVPELMKKYLMIKEQLGRSIAVVPVKNAVCNGCNMNIPPQMYNELQRFDNLRFCPYCQRIIYWKESN